MEVKTKREEIVELVNKLFVYTDTRKWAKLLKEVFMDEVMFDMSSMGGGAAQKLAATKICDMWDKGFSDIEHIHHQAGNFIVDFVNENEAQVFCYAVATHYKATAKNGKTREFVGSYDLHASLTDLGWRLRGFKYNLKYVEGNAELN